VGLAGEELAKGGERERVMCGRREELVGESTAWGGEERVGRSRVSREKKTQSFVLI
jgi:hypothetical protein